MAEALTLMRFLPDWSTDGADWPHRDCSSFVEAGGLRWHVQRAGSGPDLLLLHGTGASTHSWAGLLPLLARRFTVTAPDLPGHGFTAPPPAPEAAGLPGVAASLAALLRSLALRPTVVVGHSVGAALAARLALDRVVEPAGLVGLTPSLTLPTGAATAVASALLGPLARSPFVARIVAARIREGALVPGLLESTGSRVPPESVERYRRLLGFPGVLNGVLTLVSAWDPAPLLPALKGLPTPFLLVAGGSDRWIPPSAVRGAARSIPSARVVELPGVGHLAHEEAPDTLAALILRFADGVMTGT